MRTTSFRPRLAAVGAISALALTLGACGGSDDEALSSGDREKASAAALAYVGGGAVTDAERGDGDDRYEYQVEVTLPNGTDIDVELDDSFAVTNSPPKAADFATDDPSATPTGAAPTDASPSAVAPEDDRGLLGETRTKAEAAALKATGEGRVTGTSGSDDADHVYEVDVLLPSGEDVTVELDADFTVTTIDR
ncbi:PepSY domain-containing protein [Aeromicrobium fastidiosum]|uniref:PepSY domain-containing protein n=1 Tax=Aeromicrobium fastidiosum TaxID=52699 RepID=UPI00202349DB|nr:PepSY domain-containing protein [Aeromicrobium fastidiosum]MCL8252194.1 PepSY domain-containing protein [Aeromicrobium fastidiosum]